jgi:hypothetical protein
MTTHTLGFAPKDVRYLLRIEGLAVLVAAVTAFQTIGGNWWLFAALILAPDLAALGFLAGEKTGARVYNLVHTYTGPALLAAVAWFGGASWLMPIALIWIAHIGVDRAVGYGLKYPEVAHATHLGWMGKASKRGAIVADAS